MAWKLLPGLLALAGELVSGVRGHGPPEGSLSKPEEASLGPPLGLCFPKTEHFFPSRKKFPIPSALSCGFFLVPDTSPLYLTSPMPTPRPPELAPWPGGPPGVAVSECPS